MKPASRAARSAGEIRTSRAHREPQPAGSTVFVRNDNIQPQPVKLKAICHPGDEGEPVITVMLPHEDD